MKQDAALILYLLLNSTGGIRLDLLLDAHNLVNKKAKCWNNPMPCTRQDRELWTFTMVGGFVDVYPLSKTLLQLSTSDPPHSGTSFVRLSHETLRHAITRSDWVLKNLNPLIKKLYPDRVWFRSFCDSIAQASEADILHLFGQMPRTLLKRKSNVDVGPSEEVKHFVRKFGELLQGDERRPGVVLLLKAVSAFLAQSKLCELKGNPMYQLTAQTMKTAPAMLHLVSATCRHGSDQIWEQAVDVLRTGNCRCAMMPATILDKRPDLAFAVSHGLTGYLEHCLAVDLKNDQEGHSELFDLAWALFVRIPEDTDKVILRRLVEMGVTLAPSHVYLLLQNAYIGLGVSGAVTLAYELSKDRRRTSTIEATIHHSHHKANDDTVSLLRHWASLLVFAHQIVVVRCLLDLILRMGQPINQPCYPGGTVLNMILDYDLTPTQVTNPPGLDVIFRSVLAGEILQNAVPLLTKLGAFLGPSLLRLEKTRLLLEAGADPCIAGSNGNALDCARRLRDKHAWRARLTGYLPTWHSQNHVKAVEEANIIIQLLENHQVDSTA